MTYKKTIFSVFFALLLFLSACNNTKNAATTSSDQSVSFTVTKMYCTSCPFVVENAIKSVDGVHNVTVKSIGTEGRVTVFFDDTKTDVKTIKKSVLELGYGIK
ncbi:heavy-metal-associated domain protein [Geobacillus kaustophilus]|uniref:Heavy-metal-associated domain protein n=1 Tax=Geobacillus kaustophilus TaxID=1462 RepID=A0A0D8BU58_GEOKU|nr:cation transporter [Geobacillus kaustophilus]KJE26922.1 heavy-metal-associated domain protein [Geobacillus kaustophilus]